LKDKHTSALNIYAKVNILNKGQEK